MSSARTGRVPSRTRPLILLFIAALFLLSGCLDLEGGDEARFLEALGGEGLDVSPRQEGSSFFHLRLLDPVDPAAAEIGERDLLLLLYDRDLEPVEDATLFLESWMMDHDHGTGRESPPLHEGHGFYRGVTNHYMEGNWEVRIDGVRANGDAFWVEVPFFVQ